MLRRTESGQALVLVLLSLSVVLTLILYVLSRSIVDVTVSSGQEQSVRAFSAAEAGVERALVTGAGSSDVQIGDAKYTSTVSGFAQGYTEYAYPILLSSGDWATVWFMAHDATGKLSYDASHQFTGNSMNVYWGIPGTPENSPTTPAVEVSVFYGNPADFSTVKIARWTFDPNSGRALPNSFSNAVGIGNWSIAGETYAFRGVISLAGLPTPPANSRLIFSRIKLFYNTSIAQKVGVSVAGGILPSQGQDISSTGVAGGSNRKINVFNGWAEFPFGSDVLYSPLGLTKP